MRQPILKGPRLTLRPISLTDASNFVRWFRDKKVARFLLKQQPISLKKERQFIRKVRREKNHFIWSIFNELGRHIGSTGLKLDKQNQRGNFGIMIGEKNQWGKSYAGECIKLLADFLFKRLKFNRFELEVYMKNERALKAYKKAGFVLEGVRRHYRQNRITGRLEDEGIMSILKKDWKKKL